MLKAVTSILISALLTAAAYGTLYLADSRYVKQDTWIAESRAMERRTLNRRIDELEFQQTQRNLDAKESWELRRLKTELRELK